MSNYPEDCPQHYCGSWWIKGKGLQRGSLIFAWIPEAEAIPMVLESTGRPDDDHRTHQRGSVRIAPLSMNYRPDEDRLPVAGVQQHKGEAILARKAKRRPALVLHVGGEEIPKKLTMGKAKHVRQRSLLVAPYYGNDKSGTRGGFPDEISRLTRHCHIRQFFWDQLPGGNTQESILRLDRIQSLINASESYKDDGWRLSDEALAVLDDRLEWFWFNRLDPEGFHALLQEFYPDEDIPRGP